MCHGTHDPVITVEFGHAARDRFSQAGLDVTYREYPLPHAIDPSFAHEVGRWINDLLERP